MNKGIVVIPFNVPWNWSTDYLSQTAFELEKRGYVVACFLWCDTFLFKDFLKLKKFPNLISKYSNNIYLIYPVNFLPLIRFKRIAKLNSSINRFLLRVITETIVFKRNIKERIFWIFDPNMIFVFNKFSNKYKLIYDCVDYLAIGDKRNINLTKQNEKDVCQKADLVVANSHVLQNHLKKYRKDVKLVVQGFRSSGFFKKKKKYIDLHLKKPVIGFIGGLNMRLDLKLLIPLIKNNPNWNFVIWGPIQDNVKIKRLVSFPNVITGVSNDKSEIPSLISQFDIGMIPYDVSQDFNKYCYPMKLFEYFSMGIPVLTTPIKELSYFSDLVYIAKDSNDWEIQIKKILSYPWPKDKINKQKKLAMENSWKNKIKQITSFTF